MASPYAPSIDLVVEKILAADTLALARRAMRADFVHWDEDNEWPYAATAGYLMVVAYAFSRPWSRYYRSTEAEQMIEATSLLLVDAAVDDRWWHRKPRTGDRNIDRFTLLPLLEAYGFAGDALTEGTSQRVLDKVTRVLEVQQSEYGAVKNDAEPYPNMDAYYCLIMLHGSRLTGGAEFAAEFDRFINIMADAQFADGGWTYINGTNECPIYHDINAILMARAHHISADPRAREMLTRSIPYYPLVVAPTGRPEYYTDPWWKHAWDPQRPFAPDVVASFTADSRNRALGSRLRAGVGADIVNLKGQVNPLFLVYADMMWRDVDEVDELPEWGIVHDRNIEGPRGRFDDWSWAATARYGSDTLVGALSHNVEYGPVAALMAVTAEIMDGQEPPPDSGLYSHALAITPPGTVGTTTIEGDRCRFTCTYQLACYRSLWEQEPFPHQWECRQTWEMTERALTGRIEIISLADQPSPPPRVRIRLGRDLEVTDIGDGGYRCGPYRIRVSSAELPLRSVRPAPSVCYLKPLDAVEIVMAGEPEKRYARGQSFKADIVIRHQA